MSKLSGVISSLLRGPKGGGSSLEELEDHARPMAVVTFDVEDPAPELSGDDPGHPSAYVVALSRGVPRGTAVLEPTDDPAASSTRLREFLRQTGIDASRLPEGPETPEDQLPMITVVIPSAISRIDDLRVCLDAIGDLEYPDYEVVLVDNRPRVPSPDPLEAVVTGRPRVRVVRESRPGSSAARNAGAAAAHGELVAFVDDDVRVDRRWLRAIGERMTRDPSLDLLTGLVLPAELETPAQVWFERYFGGMGSERSFLPVTIETAPETHPMLRGRSVLVRDAHGRETRRISIYGTGGYGASANMAIRRTSMERVGGFDATLGAGTPAYGGEDLAMMIDVLWTGGRLGYEPAAFVWHHHREEYGELLKQTHGYAMGVTAMLTRMILHDPRHLVCIASKLHVGVKKKWTDARQLRHGTTAAGRGDLPPASFPPSLFRREVRGLIEGPFAYARSRRWWRRQSLG